MKNGVMFGSLAEYADSEYGREHSTISFDTLYKEGEYELLGAFYSRVYSDQDGDDVFRYYQYTDLSSPEVFASYVSQVKAASIYDTGVNALYGDCLLTLSTCSGHTEDGRFVVVARRRPS